VKVGVLFNCQHKGLANAFRALHPEWEVISFELGKVGTEEAQQSAAALLRTCDRVLTVPIGDRTFGPLLTDRLKKECNLHVLPGVAFFGFHPDTVYIFGPRGHFSAATRHYHSRIAVAAFLAGFSIEEAEILFNSLVYEKLGYFDYYGKSGAFLVNRFKLFGVDIEPWLEKWKASGCFMHSINHPKIHVVCDLALIACSIMGVDTKNDDGRLQAVPDNLAAGPQIPLYPEIAQRIGNGCSGHTFFKPNNDPAHNDFRLLPIAEYLRSCFEIYADASRDMLLKAEGIDNALQIICPSS
jgi:hypothetical protein